MICFFLSMIFLLVLLPQCGLGPKYQKPSIQMPEVYTHAHGQAHEAAKHWWESFNDEILNKLVQGALSENYSLQIALERIVQAREMFKIQATAQCPEVDFTLLANRQMLSKTMLTGNFYPSLNFSNLEAGFDMSWELDIWGSLYRHKMAALKQYEAEVESSRDTLLMVLSEVARVYVLCRSYQLQGAFLKEQVALDEHVLALAKDLQHAGLGDAIIVVQQQAVLEATRIQALSAQTMYKQAVIQLALLLGKQPEAFVLPDGPLVIPTSNKTVTTGLPSALLQRRPDIRRAERLLAASTDLVAVARGELFPHFSLLGDVHLESNKSTKWLTGNSIAWGLGPSVRWPILTFGKIKAQIREKKSEERQALLVYTQSVISALGDVEQALIRYYDAKKSLVFEKAQYRKLAEVHTLMGSLQKSGLANAIDVARAQKTVLTQVVKVAAAQQLESIALIALYKSLGGEW